MPNLLLTFLFTLCVALLTIGDTAAETRLRNICRIKGQEENTLNGYGLVVGLNGTGEAGDAPTMRAIARAMEHMGNPLGMSGPLDPAAIEELKKVKNAALVWVTATVPATGARRGEKLDCVVSAINGKSLLGGQLAFAAMLGPNLQDGRVFAVCSGTVHVEDPAIPTVGRIHDGCRMEQDVFTPFFLQEDDGVYLTLVLDEHHASFHAAHAIAEKIEDNYGRDYFYPNQQVQGRGGQPRHYVMAIDATNIRVRIPQAYESRKVQFAYEVLELTISEEDPEARVVINTRTNTIVISGDVRIGDVVVVHDNLVVAAGQPAGVAALADRDVTNPSLDRLVEQLSRLKVAEKDVIEIIRRIEAAGKLHGKLIVQ